MSISVDLWPHPAVKITSTTSTQSRLAPLCSRFLQTSPCLTELFKAFYFPSVYTIFRLIFFSLSPCLFFFFKENTASSRLRACQSLYTGFFSCQSTSPISFFTRSSELVIRLWLLMPPTQTQSIILRHTK